MSSSKSKSQAQRTVPIDKGLVPLTEREATQTVGGCGTQAFQAPAAESSQSYQQG